MGWGGVRDSGRNRERRDANIASHTNAQVSYIKQMSKEKKTK